MSRTNSTSRSLRISPRSHARANAAAIDWRRGANTPDAYRDYMQKQATGAHSKEAQDAIAALEQATAWKSAESTGTVTALQDFLKKYPQGIEADQARAKLTDIAGYRVHLSSATTEKQAQRERDRLHKKHGNLLHDVLIVPASSGKGFEVDSAPMSQSAADNTCTDLKKAHQSCEVIKISIEKG